MSKMVKNGPLGHWVLFLVQTGGFGLLLDRVSLIARRSSDRASQSQHGQARPAAEGKGSSSAAESQGQGPRASLGRRGAHGMASWGCLGRVFGSSPGAAWGPAGGLAGSAGAGSFRGRENINRVAAFQS